MQRLISQNLVEPQKLPAVPGRTLRHQFIVYGLMIAVPMLLFGFWAITTWSQVEREATERNARWHARELSRSIEHDLERAADQLRTLSTSRNLGEGKYELVYSRAAHAAEIFKASMIIRDAQGRQVINTHVPWGTTLPSTNLPPEAWRDLIAGKLHISDLYVGAVKKRPIVTVTVPIFKDGALTHSISMSLEPDLLLKEAGLADINPKWIADISDRKGRIIASSHNHSELLGHQAPPIAPSGSNDLDKGVDEVVTSDGQRVLRAYHRSPVSGWTTAIKMPLAGIEDPFKLRWQTLAVAGASLLTYALLLATFMANSLIRHFDRLSRQASALVMGETLSKRPSRLREVNAVMRSLETASRTLKAQHADILEKNADILEKNAALLRSTEAIRRSEAELRAVFDGVPIGMFRTDRNRRLISANQQLRDMTDSAGKDMNDRHWLAALPEESQRMLQEDWDIDIGRLGYFQREFPAISVRRGLGTVYINFHAVAEKDATGQTVGYIGTASDVTTRKRAEQDLTTEKNRFERLALASPDAIYMHDVSSHEITFLNRRLHGPLGLDTAKATKIGAAQFYDLIESEDVETYQRHIKGMCTALDGEDRRVEVRMRDPGGGSAIWVLIRSVVFARHDDDRVNQVLCIATDITERKTAEVQQAEIAERFKRMARASPDFVFIRDVERGQLTFLNRGIGEALGLKRPDDMEISLADVDMLIHPDDLARLAGHRVTILSALDGEVSQIEYRVRATADDGSYDWILNRAVVFARGPDGRVQQILNVATKITERKEAEQRLAAAHERYQRMALASPDVVYLYDRQAKKISFLNRSLRQTLGYPVDGQTRSGADEMYELIFPEDLDAAHAHTRAMARASDGEVLVQESRFRAPDDGVRWLSNRSVVFSRLPDGRVHQVLGIATDVTEAKRSSDQTARNLADLEARMREEIATRVAAQRELARANTLEAMGRLTGGVAHDFNNMLSIVMMFLQLFKKEYLGKIPLEDIDAALAGAETGRRLTQQLLSFARRQPLDQTPIELGSHLGSLVRWIKQLLGDDIQIRTTFPQDLGSILVEEGGFESAVINLLMNARDAMPSGGTLSIDTGNIRLAAADEEASPAGDYVFLAITDTGTGMTAEVAQRAFEPMFTTKGEYGGGTGLGLSSVYGFVKQSRGRVEVRTRLGAGTSVILYFPRCSTEDAERALSAARHTWVDGIIEGHGQAVLVVEDDAEFRSLLARMLSACGYNPRTAENGVVARQMIADALAKGEPVDAVLSDIRMPGGVSGPDLAQWIEDTAPDIAVVLMTGYDDGLHQPKEAEGGSPRRPVRRLRKPVSPEALTNGLHLALQEVAARRVAG